LAVPIGWAVWLRLLLRRLVGCCMVLCMSQDSSAQSCTSSKRPKIWSAFRDSKRRSPPMTRLHLRVAESSKVQSATVSSPGTVALSCTHIVVKYGEKVLACSSHALQYRVRTLTLPAMCPPRSSRCAAWSAITSTLSLVRCNHHQSYSHVSHVN
jgi:hypothetical protein